MKKRILAVMASVFFCITLFGGCGDKRYSFTEAKNGSIDIWNELQNTGGIREISILVNADASGEISVVFENADVNIEGRVEDINRRAMEIEADYDRGMRVVVVKKSSVKSGRLHATLYFNNINHLKSDLMNVTKNDRYDKGDEHVFYDRKGNVVSLRNLKADDVVLTLGGLFDNMKISVGGSIVAASDGFIPPEYGKDSIRYASEDCVIVFHGGNNMWILWLSIAIVVLLVVLFLFCVKFGIFTKLKEQKVKK